MKPPKDALEKRDWLRLIRSENVGPISFFRLLERFENAGEALRRLPALAKRGGRTADMRVATEAEADAELEAVTRRGGEMIAWGEPAYPPLLAHIEDPPPLIIVLGHPHLLGKRAAAVVGARNASMNGRRLAGEIATGLGDGGLCVVSGLARGIDAAAHESALPGGTVAVLGGGADVIYPQENERLYARLEAEGALLSEVPLGTRPLARHFPRRNRIISGISRGVVVVEASLRSGSLITARMALEQGREVFAVPGSPLDPRAKGTNKLIRDGAWLTESAADVLDVLDGNDARLAEPGPADVTHIPASGIDEGEVGRARSEVLGALGATPTTVDELMRACHFSLAVTTTVLLELELAGRLERHPGGKVSLIYD